MQAVTKFRFRGLLKNKSMLNYCGIHLSSSLEKKKPAAIQDLIDNIENPTSEERLDDIFKRLQSQNKKEHKRTDYVKRQGQNKLETMNKQTKIMKKYEEQSDKKGQDFWFKKKKKAEAPDEIVAAEELKVNEANEISIEIEESVERLEAEPPKETVVEIKELKRRIEGDDSGREVSKLMTAMIDSIDEGAEDVEQSFQKLIKAFNVSEVSRKPSYKRRDATGEGPVGQRRPDRRRSAMKTSFNNPTSLFGGVSSEMEQEAPSSCIEFFELKWKEELNALMPETKPRNAFEVKMLDIDREWRYPIDNEQDMGIEETTSFDEHVFLDQLLDEFPEEGPVYKFMELVVTGLQQNPYLGVEEKTSQVLWFKDYFENFSEEDLKVANLEF